MKNQRLILILTAAGIIIVILIGLLAKLLETKKLDLYNIDQVDMGLTTGQINELEEHIWQSLSNTQGYNEERTGVKALIRPSSFTRTEQDGIVNYDFIVDVDEFKASYEVSFALMKGKGFYESPLVECPAPDQMKYPGTYCKGEKTSTMTVTLGRSLPYYFNLSSGELVTVTVARSEEGEEYLNVRVSSCGDEAIKAQARNEVQAWIKSLGFDVDSYQIKIPELCDGE